jgi:hypothetical protein
VSITGSWRENNSEGNLVLRLKHTKAGAQSGGYPMVRCRWLFTNASGAEVTALDPVLDGTVVTTGGVATVDADTCEYSVTGLTDSDGSLEYPITMIAPAFAEKFLLQAKQAGDTVAGHFGTLAAELTGRI